MDISYRNKYLKYKTKYIDLKHQLGSGPDPPPPNKIDNILTDAYYKISQITLERILNAKSTDKIYLNIIYSPDTNSVAIPIEKSDIDIVHGNNKIYLTFYQEGRAKRRMRKFFKFSGKMGEFNFNLSEIRFQIKLNKEDLDEEKKILSNNPLLFTSTELMNDRQLKEQFKTIAKNKSISTFERQITLNNAPERNVKLTWQYQGDVVRVANPPKMCKKDRILYGLEDRQLYNQICSLKEPNLDNPENFDDNDTYFYYFPEDNKGSFKISNFTDNKYFYKNLDKKLKFSHVINCTPLTKAQLIKNWSTIKNEYINEDGLSKLYSSDIIKVYEKPVSANSNVQGITLDNTPLAINFISIERKNSYYLNRVHYVPFSDQYGKVVEVNNLTSGERGTIEVKSFKRGTKEEQ